MQAMKGEESWNRLLDRTREREPLEVRSPMRKVTPTAIKTLDIPKNIQRTRIKRPFEPPTFLNVRLRIQAARLYQGLSLMIS